MPAAKPSASGDGPEAALKEALERLLAPLAQLCLARGLRFAVVEEILKKQQFVEMARSGVPVAPAARDVSRVSAATGLTRREVTRITPGRDNAGGNPALAGDTDLYALDG